MAQKYKHLLNDLEKAMERAQPRINPDQKLSLCMIVRNEEEYIVEALQSARDVVDEMIVVDTGSTDRTVELAREQGAKIYHFDWCDDFAAARNESLRHATGDWILVMDADERIPEEARRNLRVLLVPVEHHISYLINIKSYIQENDDSTLNHYVVRLFRRTRESHYFGVIHEQLYPNWGQVTIPEETFHLIHLGYRKKKVKDKKIDERNIPLIRKALEQAKGKNPELYSFYCFYLGSSLTDYQEAVHWLRKSIEEAPDPNATHIPVAYVDCMRAYYMQHDYEAAAQLAQQGLATHPNFNTYMDFLDTYGVVEIYRKNYAKAIECFQKVLDLTSQNREDSIFNITRSSRTGGWGTLMNLGIAYHLSGDPENSRAAFGQVLDKHTGQDKEEVLARISAITGSTDIAQQYLEKKLALGEDEPNPYYIQQLSNIHLKNERPFEALVLQHQAYGLEKMQDTAFRLARLYEEHGRFDLAKQTYDGILSLAPDNFDALLGRMVMHLATESPTEGYHDYLHLRQMCSSDRDRWFRLGELCARLQQFDEALECFTALDSVAPNDMQGALYRSYCLQMQGRLAEAEAELLHYPAAPPSKEILVQLGNLYLTSQEYAKAEPVFQQLRDLDPSDWYASYGLGLSQLYQQNLRAGGENLRQAQALNAEEPSIQAALDLLAQQTAEAGP